MINFMLFITFFKIGLFTIGGGYAMIPMIQQNILAHGWLSQEQLIDFIAISESTPGPFAVNIATFIGISQNHFIGGLCATLGVILPSFLIILIIAKWFGKFQENYFVKSVLYGLRPAVIGLIASAALSIFCVNIFFGINPHEFLYFHAIPPINYRALFIILIVFIVSRLQKKMHPISLIVSSGALGVLSHLLFP